MVLAAELPDDELLNIPLGNLLPGELKRAFRVTSEQSGKRQDADLKASSAQLTLHQREEEATEQEREETAHREVLLFERIEAREEEIRQESATLDQRTIKLHDGRRAYVDGDRYRDAEGRELKGADRAQAELLHLEQPHAATWQERQEIKRQWTAIASVRCDAEKAQAAGGPTESAALTAAERKLQRLDTLPPYGTGDYMRELSGLTVPAAGRPAP